MNPDHASGISREGIATQLCCVDKYRMMWKLTLVTGWGAGAFDVFGEIETDWAVLCSVFKNTI